MYISCIICSDGIIPSSEIYATFCGHIFHYPCLFQWMERSKTCPQCRSRVTKETIHRIYINQSNTDHIVDDVATLQNKVDNFQFQITLKEKDIKNLTEKYEKLKTQNVLLREEVTELENKIRVHDSIVIALKDQISFFKTKSKERARLCEEIAKMKAKLKEAELVQNAINGTREEVNEMLKNETDKGSLIILAASLKKALLDTEKKKLTMEHKFKQLQNDTTKYRKDINTLESSNKELRNEMDLLKKNWEHEKLFLKNKVLEGNRVCTNRNTSEIFLESPVQLLRKSSGKNADSAYSNIPESPSVENKVVDIFHSNSPYLRVQTNSIGLGSIKSSHNSPSTQKISIFKNPNRRTEVSEKNEIVYNGLGGQSVEDVFPTSKASFLHNKKHKANSSLAMLSAKFRKLNSSHLLKSEEDKL